jgi:hypothetical protein
VFYCIREDTNAGVDKMRIQYPLTNCRISGHQLTERLRKLQGEVLSKIIHINVNVTSNRM